MRCLSESQWIFLCRDIVKRAYSSAGLEHLPYKQRVIGSNPIGPTFFQAVQASMILVRLSCFHFKKEEKKQMKRLIVFLAMGGLLFTLANA